MGMLVLIMKLLNIGKAVESECRMRHYEEEAPALLAVIKKNNWHSSSGTRQRYTNVKRLMNRYDVKEWKTWDNNTHTRLGGWLLDCIMETSGWFYKDMVQLGRRRINYVRPTAEFMAIKDQVMQESELLCGNHRHRS